MSSAQKTARFYDSNSKDGLRAFSVSESISPKVCKMGLRQACPRRVLRDLTKHFGIVMQKRGYRKSCISINTSSFIYTHAALAGFNVLHMDQRTDSIRASQP